VICSIIGLIKLEVKINHPKIFIEQPAGMGDIFFLQKLCKTLNHNHNVYHKIDKKMWDGGVNRLITPVNCHWDLPEPIKDDLVYNGSRHPNNPEDTMRAKYIDLGIDYNDWKEYFTYDRNELYEEELRKLLGIEEGEEFVLWNNRYAFNLTNNNVEKNIESDLKCIEINPTLTNIFDWCWMFENATEIHTVDTSICYIIETLNIKANVLKIHPRFKYSKNVYDGILKKSWQWIK
jgi:hypothetical protein